MATVDTRTQLVMGPGTFDELWVCAQVAITPVACEGGRALRRALTDCEPAEGGRVRVRCDHAALDFIRSSAPLIARRWPAVFGEVRVPRLHLLAALAAQMPGQVVAGVEAGQGALRLQFESGDALLIAADGTLDWRAS